MIWWIIFTVPMLFGSAWSSRRAAQVLRNYRSTQKALLEATQHIRQLAANCGEGSSESIEADVQRYREIARR